MNIELKQNLAYDHSNPYDSERNQIQTNPYPAHEEPRMQNFYTNNDDIPPHQYNQYQPDQTYVVKQEVIIQPSRSGCLSHLCDGSLEANARKNFIVKVYMILTLQLLITVGMCFISYYSEKFLHFQINNYWLTWVCLGLIIVTEIPILCCQAGRESPWGMILLLIFTLSEAYLVSFSTSYVAETKGGAIVVVAACMTLALVIALTLFALFTNDDFTTGWGILVGIIAPFILFGIFAWTAYIPVLHSLYCALGAALFGIYLVIDTQLIIGGGRYQLSLDDYISGALLLYIDIIQIFLYILSLFGNN